MSKRRPKLIDLVPFPSLSRNSPNPLNPIRQDLQWSKPSVVLAVAESDESVRFAAMRDGVIRRERIIGR